MIVGDKITFDRYDWRVLDMQNNTALVITENIIEQRAYHNKYGDVTWAGCELRKYLNGEFYEKFSKINQARIISIRNKNLDNHWYDSKGGADTQDKIFILSIEEAACNYFGNSSDLLYNPGKNQKYWLQRKDKNNIRREACYDLYEWWWWLRSPGRANNRAAYIWGNGNIGIQGNGTFKYNSNTIHPLTGDNSGGVRPALWLGVSENCL